MLRIFLCFSVLSISTAYLKNDRIYPTGIIHFFKFIEEQFIKPDNNVSNH